MQAGAQHGSGDGQGIGHEALGHLKFTTIGFGHPLADESQGQHKFGAEQNGSQHASFAAFRIIEQGGKGLQQGIGQQLLVTFEGGGQQAKRIGRTVIDGAGQHGSTQQEALRPQESLQQFGFPVRQHGSLQGPQGGQHGIGAQHLGGQMGGETTKTIFLQQGGRQHGGGMKHFLDGLIQGSGQQGGEQQTFG